jgi:hypothetical protein
MLENAPPGGPFSAVHWPDVPRATTGATGATTSATAVNNPSSFRHRLPMFIESSPRTNKFT